VGSRWPQALIQNPQAAPRGELRLDGLVILWWPVAVCGKESTVVPSTTPRLTELERLPDPSALCSSRHNPHPALLRAHHCVPSSVDACARLAARCSPTFDGSLLAIETGSECEIGINLAISYHHTY
jgi:hypothetical protein